MKNTDQKGFALTDALIGAAIAAGVFVTAAQSLSIAARASRTAQELNLVVYEAELIAARIDAGLRQGALLEGFTNWSYATARFDESETDGLGDITLGKITLTHTVTPVFSFDRIIAVGAE